MSTVTLGGNPVNVAGSFPTAGTGAADFSLTGKDLKDVSLKDFAGKRKVLNIVPSLDTPTCAKSTRVFNEKAGTMHNTVVLVVSADLPFAMKRFCDAEGLNNVVTLSTMRGRDFHGVWRRYRRRSARGSDCARGSRAGREQQGASLAARAGNQERAGLRCGAGRAASERAEPLCIIGPVRTLSAA